MNDQMAIVDQRGHKVGPVLNEWTAFVGRDRFIGAHVPTLEWLGDFNAAVLLEELVYRFDRAGRQPFTFPDRELSGHLYMGLYAMKQARKRLIELGAVKTTLSGMPRLLRYTVDLDLVRDSILSRKQLNVGADSTQHQVEIDSTSILQTLLSDEEKNSATGVASRRNGHKAAGDDGQSKATESAGAKEPPDPRVQIVMDMYAAALGYAVPNGGAQAGAAKWMLKQGYTPEQIMACYRRMKADPFWQGRALSLVSVKGQIGEQVHAQSATSWVIG